MKSNLRKPGAFFLVLLLTVTSAPLAGAHFETAATWIDVCGTIVNAVGWPVEAVHVQIYGTGLNSFNDNHLPNDPALAEHVRVTGPDGRFTFRVRGAEHHTLVFKDTLDPAHPARNGAVYTVGQFAFTATATVQERVGCGGYGKELGAVVIPSPGQGFVEAVVRNATAGDHGLAGVDVSLTPSFDPRDLDELAEDAKPSLYPHSLHTHTNGTGVARFACQGPPSQRVPYVLFFTSFGHMDASRVTTCRESALSHVALDMWRRPVLLTVTVFNQTDVSDRSPVDVEPKSGVLSPFEGAAVRVEATPAGLTPLVAGSTACGDGASTDGRPALATTNASPYVCAGVTDKAGNVTLRLPWAESPYAFAASGSGHLVGSAAATLKRYDARLSYRAAFGPDGEAAGTQHLAVTLRRPSFTVTDVVTDVDGAPLSGVWVNLTNDAGTVRLPRTGADGVFTATLQSGPYRISFEKEGYNSRLCAGDVEGVTTATGRLANLTRADCLALLRSGTSAVRGLTIDTETGKPIPGLKVCATATACTLTRADGSYHLEVPAGSAYTFSIHAGQPWTAPAAASANAPPLDGHENRTLASLARSLSSLSLFTYVQNGDAVEGQGGTAVNVTRGTERLVTAGTTTSRGLYTIDVVWNKHPTLPQFTTPDFVVEAVRHKVNGPLHLAQSSKTFDVGPGHTAAAPLNVTIAMTEEGWQPTAVQVFDAHTGAQLQGNVVATIEGEGTDVKCPDARCKGTTATGLKLYNEHPRHKVCADIPGYSKTECKVNVAAGTSVTLRINRTSTVVQVTVLDAHTGTPAMGVVVTATVPAGMECAPPGPAGTFLCSEKSDSTGTVQLKLPWTSDRGPACMRTAAGAAGVLVTPDKALSILPEAMENVKFQAAERCQVVPSGVSSVNAPIRPLRVAGAPLTGAVVAAVGGGPVPGARVLAKVERDGFACNPVGHNSSWSGNFSACVDGVDASSGTFSATLPMTPLPHQTWGFNATAPGHFEEGYTHVLPAASTKLPHPFTLWPKAFDATFVIRDRSALGDPHPCVASEGMFLLVRELGDANPFGGSAGTVVANPDGTCGATVRISDWNRDPQPMPAHAGPWRKDAVQFLAQLFDGSHAGVNATTLGPLAARGELDILHVPDRDRPYVGGRIVGTVTDADAKRDEADGLAGVQVYAERVQGPCHGREHARTFRGFTDATGAYAIAVACGGQYKVRAEHSSFYQPRETLVDLGASIDQVVNQVSRSPSGAVDAIPVRTADFDLPRAMGGLHVLVKEIDVPVANVPGVRVDPAGVDVAADPAMVVTDASGAARFVPLPWGVYTVSVAADAPQRVLTPVLTVFVMPTTAATQTTAYTFST